MKKHIDPLSSADEIRKIRKNKWLKSNISDEILWILDLDITKDIVKGIKKFSTSNTSSVKVFIPDDMTKSIKKISSDEGISTLKKDKKNTTLYLIDKYLQDKWFKVWYLKKVSTSRDYGGWWDSNTHWYITVSI